MVKCKKTIALLLIFILIIVISMNLVSYAFFAIDSIVRDLNVLETKFKPISEDQNIIGANNYKTLLNAVTDKNYNNANEISDKRVTVRLLADISLSSDLNINADVNIDFNGKNIHTNGNKIEVNHFYKGVFNLYNGKIIGSNMTETLRISTPNAYIITDTLKLESIEIEMLETNANQIFDASAMLIADALIAVKRTSSIESDYLLHKNRYCTLHETMVDNHNCCYVYEDIDLPKQLLASGATIAYTTSDNSIVSNIGKVNADGINGFVNIILNATVTYNGQSRQYDFMLHVYDINSNAAEAVAVAEAVENLENYYYKGDLDNVGYVELYNITEPVLLPKYASTNGKELYYETLNSDNALVDSSTLLKSDNFKIPDVASDSGYIMTLNDSVKKLRISTIKGDFQQVIDVNGQNSQAINDNYAAAIKIAKSLYGDEIVITDQKRDEELGNTENKQYLNGYTSDMLVTDVSAYATKYGVKSITYGLLNNIDATYTLGDNANQLYVKNINYLPNEIQNDTLKMRFEFNTEPITVSVNIPIRYDPQTDGDGNNIAKFLPYYNYFDRLLLSVSGGNTYDSFEMPFGYGVDGAVYYYEVYNANGTLNTELLNVQLKYSLNQVEYNKSIAEVTALNAELIKEIMLSGTAKWEISFNTDKLPIYDTVIKLRYRYKFYGYSSEWYGNDTQPYESSLNVKGVIKLSDMPDAALYKYIYDCARPNKFNPEYVDNAGMLIVTDWLDKTFLNAGKVSKIDLSGGKINDASAISSNGKSVSNIKGLEYVKNIDILDLSSSGIIAVNDIEYIRQISGLKELNLAKNGLYDRINGTLGLPSGSNNNTLTKLQDLKKLEKLHLENNAFYYFTGLEGMKSLKDVCVFDNKHTSSISAFTALLNTLYGTDGMVNRSLYGKLSSAGVIVRNVNENEGFSQLADNDVMEKLENIEYQKKLPQGIGIEKCYESLSLNPRDYGIENMGNSVWWGSQKDDSIEFLSVGDSLTATKFTIRYKYYYLYGLFQTQEIELDVELEVIRY